MSRYRIRNGRLNRALALTRLEDRTTPTTIDVTGVGAGSYADSNNVFVRHVDVPPTGTGLIDPFLRVHRQGSEHGYNTDYRADGNPSQNLLDDLTDTNFTNAITLGQVREVRLDGSGNIVSSGGELYREFRLDLGEPGNSTSESGLVNFSRLQFFLSSSPTEHIDQAGAKSSAYVWNNTLGAATLAYNLDASDNIDFTLRDLTSGNGALDYAVYVRSSLLGTDMSKYLYLYSAFGTPPPGSDGTFEEWAAEEPAVVTGSISGTKWEDGDGDLDTADYIGGLGGFTIYVDVNGNTLNDQPAYSTVTAADGTYTISGIPVGTYTVYEVSQEPDYTVVIGVVGGVAVTNGGNTTGVDFANFQNVDIDGGPDFMKFEDHNGNGVQDAEDGGLAGWTIELYRESGDTDGFQADEDEFVDSFTTGPDGYYSFSNITPGMYYVREVGQDGWTQTFPADDGGVYTFTAASGTTPDPMTFGNFENIDICGMKFYDANTNGEFDIPEALLAGWTIFLDGDGDNALDWTDSVGGNGVWDAGEGEQWTVTGVDGKYCLTDLGPGMYTVREVLTSQPGTWFQTTSNPDTITVGGSGQQSGQDVDDVNFGNVKLVGSGGLTLGYWSNQNGQALLTGVTTKKGGTTILPGYLAGLNTLNLTGGNTGWLSTGSYAGFRSWILNATATNMAYMLSAQLAASYLNSTVDLKPLEDGLQTAYASTSALVYIPAVIAHNPQGTALEGNLNSGPNPALVSANHTVSIQAIMDAAVAALGADGDVGADDSARPYYEALKIVLDALNNSDAILIA